MPGVDVSLAHASDAFFKWTVLVYAIAMFGYSAEFAFARIARSRAEKPAQYDRRISAEQIGRAAVGLTVVGWLLHIGSVVTRGWAVGRVPWGNMYEFSTMVALVAVTVFLALLLRQPVRFLGVFVMTPVVLYLGLAGTVLYVPAAPLQPILNSYWIKIHVVAAITASGAFMVSGVITMLYLTRTWLDRRASMGPGTAAAMEYHGFARWLPSADRLDRLTYKVIGFAFPVWTFAVIAGAIWAENAWGRYWGWDPKETWAFITWLVYACYLHARATAGWRGRKAAYLALLGYSTFLFNYLVVNIFLVGLHSYAGVG